MTEQRTIAPTEDPVCGMTVDPAEARGSMAGQDDARRAAAERVALR